jgi:hypothetical protein
MDFSTFFTITFVAILSSGIGYSFWAIYQLKKLQSEIQRLAKDIRKDFKNKNI